jgi:hypothetical protein
MTGEGCVGSQAEDPIHPVGAAPVEHLRTGIMAVAAQEDLNLGPQGADSADQATHKAADLVSARPLAGPQHGRHKAPLAVEDDDRLETVIIMKGIEQAQLLAAMHAVEEPALAKAGVSSISSTMRLGGCRNGAQYCSISARPRRSSARTSGRFSNREIVDCEHNSSSEGNRSSASLNIGSQRSVSASLPSSYPAAIISMRNRIISAKRCTTFSGARGPLRQAAKQHAANDRAKYGNPLALGFLRGLFVKETTTSPRGWLSRSSPMYNFQMGLVEWCAHA